MPSIDLTSLGSVLFDGKEVQVLQLNGVEIWTASKPDEYILNVSSVASSDLTGIKFYVVVGEGGGTVTFNGETLSLIQTSSDVNFDTIQFTTSSSGITGDIKFKGDFSSIETSSVVIVNSIKLLYKNWYGFVDGQFQNQTINFDVDVRGVYDNINMLAFNENVTPDTFGSGKLLFDSTLQQITGLEGYMYYKNFFSNSTNTGQLWVIQDAVFATSIGSASLVNVTIPSGTRILASGLFSQTGYDHSAYLETITFQNENLIKEIPKNFCKSAPKLANINIPNSVEVINREAFSGCEALTNIDLPINLKKIDSSAFSSCTALTSVVLPDGLQELGSSAFSSCTSLTSVTIPESITEISNSLFNGCTGFTELVIPAHINKIGNLAFASVKGSLRFMQPAGMTVSLPTAGTNGMCYVKSATSLTIYTDNETIKNYNWASDNITPTLYHLDGSAWS